MCGRNGSQVKVSVSSHNISHTQTANARHGQSWRWSPRAAAKTLKLHLPRLRMAAHRQTRRRRAVARRQTQVSPTRDGVLPPYATIPNPPFLKRKLTYCNGSFSSYPRIAQVLSHQDLLLLTLLCPGPVPGLTGKEVHLLGCMTCLQYRHTTRGTTGTATDVVAAPLKCNGLAAHVAMCKLVCMMCKMPWLHSLLSLRPIVLKHPHAGCASVCGAPMRSRPHARCE